MKLKYLSKKNENQEYVVSDEELFNFIEMLCEKYNLRTTCFKGAFVHDLERGDVYVECVLSRYMSDDAPIRQVEDGCFFNDFDFSSLHLYNEDVVNIKTDFRKFMISKFFKLVFSFPFFYTFRVF